MVNNMKHFTFLLYLTVFTTSTLLFLFTEFGCQHSNPVVNNPPNGPNSKGYNLYVGNWGFDEVFVIDTDSNAVVDTLRGFGSVWDLAVTKSGKKLYISTREGPVNFPGKVYSVDLQTRHIKLILDKVADVYVVPNGIVIIISKDPFQLPRQIGTIDTLSDAITFFDTLDVRDAGVNYQSVVLDRTFPLFYAVNNALQLFAYDYEQRKVVRVFENLFGPKLHMVLSPDGKFLYAAGGPVFDLERDAAIAGVGGNHLGSLALSADGGYLYITDPGGYLLPEPVPSGKVFIFQTSTNTYNGEIDVQKAVPFGHGWQTDRIVLMPDGRTAYVSNWLDLIFVIDLQQREVVKLIQLGPTGVQAVPMVVGLKY